MPTANLVSQLNLEEVIRQTKRFIFSIDNYSIISGLSNTLDFLLILTKRAPMWLQEDQMLGM